MAPYSAFFYTALTINVIVTIRSSRVWDYYVKDKKRNSSDKTNSRKDDHKEEEVENGANNTTTIPLIQDSESTTSTSTKNKEELESKHSHLVKIYLAVYMFAVLSDWLQGPYVYALYDAYGYSQHMIAVLFVAGFGSSMAFGSFVGSLADSYGRRQFTIIFCVAYALSCVTKHFHNFGILMLGRILGGICTSLLFSVFDSWLIRSHADMGLSDFLSSTFSTASYANSVVAIVAGLLSERVASFGKIHAFFPTKDHDDSTSSHNLFYVGGYLLPFDVAILSLLLCGTFAITLWHENYGNDPIRENLKENNNSAKHKNLCSSFKNAFYETMRTPPILLCGLISSLYEGSMYIFVFMWTPALKDLSNDNNNLPFGFIFATFMISCMAGSSTFALMVKSYNVQTIALSVLIIATLAFNIMYHAKTDTYTILGFLLFEFSVGIYFPAMGTMKSSIVPEEKRATIYNLYRIPLNFIVLSSLLTDLSHKTSFGICVAMMTLASVLQYFLRNILATKVSNSSNNSKSDLELELATPN